MAQSLCHGQIGIVELHIFAHQTDGDGFAPVVDSLHQCLPLLQLRLRGGDPQLPADDAGEILLFQHQGSLVQVGQGDVFNDAVGLYIAEQADFLEDAVLQGLVAAQNHDVRLDTHALQLPDGVLGGLGLVLIGATEEGHQRHMDEQTVLLAHLQRNLPDSLQKGLGLDIADGAADFGDYHIGVRLLAYPVDEFLDFIGDMGNDLNGGAKVFPPALLVQHIPVDLSRGQVGKLVQILVDEPLVVTQIQIRFRAVLGDIHLAVLIGAHGAGVHIDIGVQLLGCHLQSPGLHQSAQGSCRDALAQTGNHTAGYKNIFCHQNRLLYTAALVGMKEMPVVLLRRWGKMEFVHLLSS